MSNIFSGNNSITEVYAGSIKISSIYMGSTLLWDTSDNNQVVVNPTTDANE